MTSCTIIVSHYESLPFLRACIRQIRKYAHPEVEQIIYIAEQSGAETKDKVIKEFASQDDIVVCNMAPLYSGYGIDIIVREIMVDTEFICQIHTDVLPIHKNWLFVPITLIQEQKFAFVGQFQFVSDGSHSIYPPEPFCAMSQCFNVAKTETYKELSEYGGFTRFHNRPQSGLGFRNTDWAQWAASDYQARGSDDDVVAFHWQDKYNEVMKLDLAITGMIGRPQDGSSYGRVIDELVFHFGSCNEARGVMDKMPKKYQRWTKIINDEGFDDDLLEELLLNVRENSARRQIWDGKTKKAYPVGKTMDEEIDFLKSEP